ncbi:hypothetical protein HZB88_03275 [archaeon]|nr:hypothetical protein [archaeon]
MGMGKFFGWLLIISGISVMAVPFISGFTGYFSGILGVSSFITLSSEISIMQLVIGAILTAIGLLIVKPKKESFVG